LPVKTSNRRRSRTRTRRSSRPRAHFDEAIAQPPREDLACDASQVVEILPVCAVPQVGKKIGVLANNAGKLCCGQCSGMAAESVITGLADRGSQELRLAWRRLYRAAPSLGRSRDLMIRAVANKVPVIGE
jgi:hypothetical protein